MAKISVEKFIETIERSKLIEPDQLSRRWPIFVRERPPPSWRTADFFAAALIAAGLLTRWQSDNLLKGKHKGFFLGKYKLLGHLGTGGMSSVYLAQHVLMNRRVAIKVLPKARVNDSSYLARFHLEAQAAARLDNVNIVRVYDVDSQDDDDGDDALHRHGVRRGARSAQHRAARRPARLPPGRQLHRPGRYRAWSTPTKRA